MVRLCGEKALAAGIGGKMGRLCLQHVHSLADEHLPDLAGQSV